MMKLFFVLVVGLLLAGCGKGDIAGVGYYDIPGANEYLTFYVDHVEELQLTKQQEQTLRQLRTDTLKDADHRGVELRILNRELRDILKADDVDVPGAEQRIKKLIVGVGDLGISYVQAVAKAKKVLTPQQLKAAKELQERLGLY